MLRAIKQAHGAGLRIVAIRLPVIVLGDSSLIFTAKGASSSGRLPYPLQWPASLSRSPFGTRTETTIVMATAPSGSWSIMLQSSSHMTSFIRSGVTTDTAIWFTPPSERVKIQSNWLTISALDLTSVNLCMKAPCPRICYPRDLTTNSKQCNSSDHMRLGKPAAVVMKTQGFPRAIAPNGLKLADDWEFEFTDSTVLGFAWYPEPPQGDIFRFGFPSFGRIRYQLPDGRQRFLDIGAFNTCNARTDANLSNALKLQHRAQAILLCLTLRDTHSICQTTLYNSMKQTCLKILHRILRAYR